jgi:hypothetical protein
MKIRVAALLVIGLAIPGLVLRFAFGQPVTQNAVSGNECWSAAQGPGGPSQWLCIPTVRNGSDLTLVSGSGAFTSTATGGTLYWVGTAPTTWAVTLPSPAFDGQIVRLDTDTTLTTRVTVTAGSGSTLAAAYSSQTLTALTPVDFQYDAPSTTWYRLR